MLLAAPSLAQPALLDDCMPPQLSFRILHTECLCLCPHDAARAAPPREVRVSQLQWHTCINLYRGRKIVPILRSFLVFLMQTRSNSHTLPLQFISKICDSLHGQAIGDFHVKGVGGACRQRTSRGGSAPFEGWPRCSAREAGLGRNCTTRDATRRHYYQITGRRPGRVRGRRQRLQVAPRQCTREPPPWRDPLREPQLLWSLSPTTRSVEHFTILSLPNFPVHFNGEETKHAPRIRLVMAAQRARRERSA